MVTDKQIKDEMTNIIYKHIFGLNQAEFIRMARRKAGNWTLDDEGARDMLSIEALSALAEVEGACAEMYPKLRGTYIQRVEAMRRITHYIASQYKVENMWYEETDED